jgi:hypothetical protein
VASFAVGIWLGNHIVEITHFRRPLHVATNPVQLEGKAGIVYSWDGFVSEYNSLVSRVCDADEYCEYPRIDVTAARLITGRPFEFWSSWFWFDGAAVSAAASFPSCFRLENSQTGRHLLLTADSKPELQWYYTCEVSADQKALIYKLQPKGE